MKLLYKYKNGNYDVFLYEDGTKIRYTKETTWESSFAENIDIKLTNKCTGTNCSYCHEGSGPDGKHGDILNLKFWNTLHKGQEVALGGGNVIEHPDFISLLKKLKKIGVISNITLNQFHFLSNIDLIKELIKDNLIYGIGVSLIYPSKTLINALKQAIFKNVVIHTINGILSEYDIKELENKGFKLLILGYKHLRRGNDYFDKEKIHILDNQKWLENNILDILNKFEVVSFDNLALEQLNMKDKIDKDVWEESYMGDDGTSTFYIDCVNEEFAKSSTAPLDKRYKLLDNVDEMFKVIQK